MAARCLFAREYLSEVLQDRFICGLRSKAMQKKLLSEDNFTLQKAVDIAKSAEAASKHARALNMKTATSDLAVGAIEGSSHSTSRRDSPPQGGHTGRTCYRCAKAGHFAHDCPYKDVVCHKCGKKGHLAKTCRGGKGKPKGGANVGRTNFVGSPGSADKRDETFSDENISNINRVSGEECRPYVVTVDVNGSPLRMQVDTRAAVSLISHKLYRQRFASLPLTPSPVHLHTYTSEPIWVLGQIKVSVSYKGYVGSRPLVVVDSVLPFWAGTGLVRSV